MSLRRQVLNAFKTLHRTCQNVFATDERALVEGRKKINEHFRKNQNETDPAEINKMLSLAQAVEQELKNNVIQAVEKEKGVFELHIREETTKLENIMFDPNANIPTTRRRTKVSGCNDTPNCGEANKVQQ